MINDYFRDIMSFWWRHLGAIFLVTAPFALLSEGLQLATGPALVMDGDQVSGFNMGSIIVVLLLRPLAEATLIMQLGSLHAGKARGLMACLLPALSVYPLVLATYFFIALGVSLGWFALFFPALWVYTRLCFAPFLVVLRGQRPLEALSNAFKLSQRQQWPLLFTLVMTFLLVLMVSGLVSGLLVGMLGQGGQLVTGLFTSLVGATVSVTAFRYLIAATEEQDERPPAQDPQDEP